MLKCHPVLVLNLVTCISDMIICFIVFISSSLRKSWKILILGFSEIISTWRGATIFICVVCKCLLSFNSQRTKKASPIVDSRHLSWERGLVGGKVSPRQRKENFIISLSPSGPPDLNSSLSLSLSSLALLILPSLVMIGEIKKSSLGTILPTPCSPWSCFNPKL